MPAEIEIPPALRITHAQLLLAARREAWVGDAVAAALGRDAATVLSVSRRAHPVTVPGTAADLARAGDPHDALERTIAALLMREAAGHRALLLLHGDDAEVRLRLAAFDHGADTGRELSRKGPLGPQGAFDAIGAAVLEDMPCRPHAMLLDEAEARVRWAHARCPYKAAWSRAGADFRQECQVISAWIRGLASGLDPAVEYRRPKALALGDDRCEHELVILRK